MKLIGDFVDIVCRFKPEYKQHVRYKNENKGFVSDSSHGDLWLH